MKQDIFSLAKAQLEDTSDILNLYIQAKIKMKKMGIDQWQNDQPGEKSILQDIADECLWVLKKSSKIIGVAAIIDYPDSNYKKINGAWINTSNNYIAIHRFTIAEEFKGKKMADYFFKKAVASAKKNNFLSIRIDTHKDNTPMQHWIKRQGFSFCGIVQVSDGTDRNAYEQLLSD